MQKPVISFIFSLFLILTNSLNSDTSAQMITGTWKGKIDRQKVEVKIILQGDSLTGTSYYYESANNFRRYSIKGYFDGNTNEAVWWDDHLIEAKSRRYSITTPGKTPMLSQADFNCPGGSRMMLDGKTNSRENKKNKVGEVHLDKTSQPFFEDEWDFVIQNYTIGGNDPDIIDSIKNIAFRPDPVAEKPAITKQEEVKVITPSPQPVLAKTDKKQRPVPQINNEKTKPLVQQPDPVKPISIEEKFTTRTKTFIKEIPIRGDSIELRFYDNAEIDGDSISLFLNNKLIFQHIRLTANPFIVKLSVADLADSNELIMVAENLGTIPPNTSYMIAIVNEQRFDAYLASTEGESAMIRLIKPK